MPLNATLVEQYGDLGEGSGNRPLVFLNACQVGRSGYQLTRTGGFAQGFLKAGAGIFVSTLWSVVDEPALWSVVDEPARRFTEVFCGQLVAGYTRPMPPPRPGRSAGRMAIQRGWHMSSTTAPMAA